MNTRTNLRAVLAVAAASLFVTWGQSAVRASDTVYETMPSGYIQGYTGTGFGGPIQSGVMHTEAFAFSFTGSQAYSVDTVEVLAAVSPFYSGYELDILLMTDDGGLPGTVIESFAFTGPFPMIAENTSQLQVTESALHPILQPNTTYWVAGTGPVDSIVAWVDAPVEFWTDRQTPTVVNWTNVEGEPWLVGGSVPPHAYRITGTPVAAVPAPGALLLGVVGTGLLGGLRRRRSRAEQA